MSRAPRYADEYRVIWPAAALAILLLGFVVVYGSTLQTRLGSSHGASEDASAERGQR
jgi:hypothetical protein